MATALSREDIAAEVAKAMEATLQLEPYPDRLWPYTAAELNFMKDFVTQALTAVMLRASSR